MREPIRFEGAIVRKWILAVLWIPVVATAAPATQANATVAPTVAQAAQAQGKATESDGAPGAAGGDQGEDWGGASTPFSQDSQAQDKRFAEQDPWEGFNRKVFSFNQFTDRWLLKPVARGYRWITPQWLNDTITRVFENLDDLKSSLNSVLQWRWGNAGDDFGRFAVNSTLGVAGLFDVASRLDIPKHSTGLDMTLARWGVHAGPYLVLPILGPSTVRGAGAYYPGTYLWAPSYIADDPARYGVYALYGIDTRADLLGLEKNIVGDRYTFLRDAYLQKHVFDTDNRPPPLPDDDKAIKSNDGW